VTAVIPSKTQRNLFYARTDVGGAYRWDNAVGRWVPLLDSLSEDDVGLMGVESMALDAKDPAVVYVLAGTSYFSNGKTVVMRSADYGATFARTTDVSAMFRVHGNGLGRGNGEKMQVDPGSSNVLYVGSRNNGLFKSIDSGASFARVNALPVIGTPNEAGISFVVLDPASVANGVAQRIIVGVSRYGSVGTNLYRSDDAGSSFSAVANAPAGFIPQRAALAGDGSLYITYGNGSGPHGDSRNLTLAEPMDAGQVWKYAIASGTWTNVTPTGITGPFSGVSTDPNNSQRVLVSTVNNWLQQGSGWGDHFFITANGGSTWTDVVARGFALDTNGVSWVGGNTIHWANSIEFDPFDAKAAWVTSGNGVFRTANLDAVPTTWTFAVKGLEETVPLGLVSVPAGPLLSVIGDYDGYRHTDVSAYAPIHAPRIGTTSGLAVAAANTSVVVRVGRDKMYRSADTGVTWTQVPVAPATSITDGAVALSADGSTLLHTMTAGGVSSTYRSTNFASAGPTWNAVSGLSGRPVRPAADPVRASKFYAYDSGSGEVLTSSDGGAAFAVAATLAAGGSTRLVPAPGREGDLWIALRDGGLVRSINSGASFSRLSNVSFCSAVGFGKTLAGASYPTVFIWGAVGGGKRGLYRSADAGASWSRINDDAHQFGGPGNGQFVVGDMNTEGMVYMSTVGRGIVYGAPATAP